MAKPPVRMSVPVMMYGLTLPLLETRRPATAEDTRTPSIIGMVSRPASVGE